MKSRNFIIFIALVVGVEISESKQDRILRTLSQSESIYGKNVKFIPAAVSGEKYLRPITPSERVKSFKTKEDLTHAEVALKRNAFVRNAGT